MDNTEEDFQNYDDFAWATNGTVDHNYIAMMELNRKMAEDKSQVIDSSLLLQIKLTKYAEETTNLTDEKGSFLLN